MTQLDGSLDFRLLFDAALEAIVVLDVDSGLFIDANQAAERLFGLPRRELLANGPLSQSPEFQPDGRRSAPLAEEMIGRAVAGESPVFDWQHLDSDGNLLTCEIRLSRLPLAERTLVMATMLDRTKEAEREESLNEALRQLNEAQHLAHLGSWSIDLGKERPQWSPEFWRLLELDPDQHSPAYELYLSRVHPEDRDFVRAAYDTAFDGGGGFDINHRLLMPDGRVKRVHEYGDVEYGRDGRPILGRGTLQDVTARDATRTALIESQKMFTLLLRDLPEAVLIADSGQLVSVFSAGAARTFGYCEQAAVGQPFSTFVPDVGTAIRNLRQEQTRDASDGAGYPFEAMAVRADGSKFPASCVLSELETSDNTYFTLVLRDVTVEKEAQAATLRAKAVAEEASDAKSHFIANMSHELRTPLNAIIGFAEMIAVNQERVGSETVREYAEYILTGGNRLMKLINDVLTLSRLELGGLRASETEFSLDELVRGTLRLMDFNDLGRDRPMLDLPEPSPLISGDFRLLREAFLCLLANAYKYSEEGSPVTLSCTLAPDGWLHASVIDKGVGMDAETLRNVGEPFHQEDSSFTRLHEGAGLGLALARRFVELHGGRLGLESSRRTGTRATVSLPPDRVT